MTQVRSPNPNAYTCTCHKRQISANAQVEYNIASVRHLDGHVMSESSIVIQRMARFELNYNGLHAVLNVQLGEIGTCSESPSFTFVRSEGNTAFEMNLGSATQQKGFEETLVPGTSSE